MLNEMYNGRTANLLPQVRAVTAVCSNCRASCYLKVLQCSVISFRYSFPGKPSLDLLIIWEHAHQATYTTVLAMSVRVSMKDRRKRVAAAGQSPSLGCCHLGTPEED